MMTFLNADCMFTFPCFCPLTAGITGDTIVICNASKLVPRRRDGRELLDLGPCQSPDIIKRKMFQTRRQENVVERDQQETDLARVEPTDNEEVVRKQ